MITELAPVLEALLLASDKPLSVERLGQVFDEHDGVDNKRIKKALRELQKSYDGRGYQLVEVASGFRFQVQQGYALWVARLWQEKPQNTLKRCLKLYLLLLINNLLHGERSSQYGV